MPIQKVLPKMDCSSCPLIYAKSSGNKWWTAG